VHAARTRLRPILMTSLSFILGVGPLAVATGAGAEMRQSLGTAVLFGMMGVTCFGLVFTPAFYTFIRRLGHKEHGGDLHIGANSTRELQAADTKLAISELTERA
jgi:Cu/Ag efflux pump CusA